AAVSLQQIDPGNKETLPTLASVLRDDPDEEMRSRAAWRIGELRTAGKPALPALIAALKDKSSDVRVSVLGALTRIHPSAKSVIDALTRSLKDRDGPVRQMAASCLNEAKGGEIAIPALVEATE